MNALILTAFLVALEVGAFLRFAPVGADEILLRAFNRRALAYLIVLCIVFVVALAFRASEVELALVMANVFLLVFVPLYLTFAGLFRSRALSSFHRGGRSTV